MIVIIKINFTSIFYNYICIFDTNRNINVGIRNKTLTLYDINCPFETSIVNHIL